MVHIVTGKINSGKSTVITSIYNKLKKGDGFISVKKMSDKKVHSYNIMKLSDNSQKLFVIRDEFLKEEKEISCQIGPYLFIKDALEYIETEIRKMIKMKISPIFLDEIGQLELYDQCFHNIFEEILSSNTDCYITIREDLVDKVIDKYQIKEVKIISR